MRSRRMRWLLFVVFAMFVQGAFAQAYPNKAIRFIVGFAPGGPNDIVARMVAQKLGESLAVPVTVDNRPGADSIIGTQIAQRSAPDGYTITMISASATIHPSVYNNVPYDLIKDFSPVTVVATGAFVVVVNPQVPANSIKELIALAKAKPSQLNFASSGVGGSLHLAGELFKSLAHVNMTHVPYKGGAPALNDVMGGQVQVMFSPIAIAMPQIKAGRVRALAVTSARRWPTLPDLPTVAEAGLTGYEATGWYGIVAPANTPAAIIATLNGAIVKLLARNDVREQFAKLDLEALGTTPQQMTAHLQAELAKWADVVRDAKLAKGSIF